MRVLTHHFFYINYLFYFDSSDAWRHASGASGPVKKDGTPDKRYTANKKLTKDGASWTRDSKKIKRVNEAIYADRTHLTKSVSFLTGIIGNPCLSGVN